MLVGLIRHQGDLMRKHRMSRWFCAFGHHAPRRWEPVGCPECGVTLVRVLVGPLEDERRKILGDQLQAVDPHAHEPLV